MITSFDPGRTDLKAQVFLFGVARAWFGCNLQNATLALYPKILCVSKIASKECKKLDCVWIDMNLEWGGWTHLTYQGVGWKGVCLEKSSTVTLHSSVYLWCGRPAAAAIQWSGGGWHINPWLTLNFPAAAKKPEEPDVLQDYWFKQIPLKE